MEIFSSSVSGNTGVREGGGIRSFGVIELTNSTISGNILTSIPMDNNHGGAGIYVSGTLKIASSTITANSSAVNGGGIFVDPSNSASIEIKNSILAGNSAAVSGPDCAATLTSLGHNLVGDDTGCGGVTDGLIGDQVGTSGSPLDPLLGPLNENGGPSLSHALLVGSPAINAGTPVASGGCTDLDSIALANDQRGLPRPTDSGLGTVRCDIGAFEFPQDSDGDGIFDDVDTQVLIVSDDLSDIAIGGTSFGTIVNRGGQNLSILKSPGPGNAISMRSDLLGVNPQALVQTCGTGAVRVGPGDDVMVICGSLTVDVISGGVDNIVEVPFFGDDGSGATTNLTAGQNLTFEEDTGAFTAPSTNTGPIVIVIDGSGLTLNPGETVIPITIDIKPGSELNCFNNNGHGVFPVAILGSVGFDVTQVDIDTIELDGQEIRVVGKQDNTLASIHDVNGDGIDDLLVQIQDKDGVYEEGDSFATLSGNLTAEFGSTNIKGTDSICIVP